TCGKNPSGSQAMTALQSHLEVCQNFYESAFSQYMSRLNPCVIPLRDQLQSEIKEKPAISQSPATIKQITCNNLTKSRYLISTVAPASSNFFLISSACALA